MDFTRMVKASTSFLDWLSYHYKQLVLMAYFYIYLSYDIFIHVLCDIKVLKINNCLENLLVKNYCKIIITMKISHFGVACTNHVHFINY